MLWYRPEVCPEIGKIITFIGHLSFSNIISNIFYNPLSGLTWEIEVFKPITFIVSLSINNRGHKYLQTRLLVSKSVWNRATLKWSFYVTFCPPSTHPSDRKKLLLTLSLSDVRPGAKTSYRIDPTVLAPGRTSDRGKVKRSFLWSVGPSVGVESDSGRTEVFSSFFKISVKYEWL